MIICKHCGMRIYGRPGTWIHEDYLVRCRPDISGLPYGYDAAPKGEPCSPACMGSRST